MVVISNMLWVHDRKKLLLLLFYYILNCRFLDKRIILIAEIRGFPSKFVINIIIGFQPKPVF